MDDKPAEPSEIDPEEFLRQLLRIPAEEAAKARADAAETKSDASRDTGTLTERSAGQEK